MSLPDTSGWKPAGPAGEAGLFPPLPACISPTRLPYRHCHLTGGVGALLRSSGLPRLWGRPERTVLSGVRVGSGWGAGENAGPEERPGGGELGRPY